MNQFNCAIYLSGHGPQRQPRFIELQHRTILRAIPWLQEHWDARLLRRDVFIDLNFPPGPPFPALDRLVEAIETGTYTHVLMNIAYRQSMDDQDLIRIRLFRTGATLYNVGSRGGALTQHLVEMYGEDLYEQAERCSGYINDEAEFLSLFPATSAAVMHAFLRDENLDGKAYRVVSDRIDSLERESPYQRHFVPWPRRASAQLAHNEMRQAREELSQKRRETELLYKLAPHHEGCLRDENGFQSVTRQPDDLAWAERRLCDDLGFVRKAEGRVVSFQRKVDDILLFGDPRWQRSLRFRAYRVSRKARPRTDLSFMESFKLPDAWKHDLESKLVRLARKLKKHQITEIPSSK